MAARDPALRTVIASLASNTRLAKLTAADRVELTRKARQTMWEKDLAAVREAAAASGETLDDEEAIRRANYRRRVRLAEMSRKAAEARRLRGGDPTEPAGTADHFLAGYLSGLREALAEAGDDAA